MGLTRKRGVNIESKEARPIDPRSTGARYSAGRDRASFLEAEAPAGAPDLSASLPRSKTVGYTASNKKLCLRPFSKNERAKAFLAASVGSQKRPRKAVQARAQKTGKQPVALLPQRIYLFSARRARLTSFSLALASSNTLCVNRPFLILLRAFLSRQYSRLLRRPLDRDQ